MSNIAQVGPASSMRGSQLFLAFLLVCMHIFGGGVERTEAAQHGVTTPVSFNPSLGSQPCSADNTLSTQLEGTLVLGRSIAGTNAGREDRVRGSCTPGGVDAIYAFNPDRTGRYRVELTAESSDSIIFIMHCNGGLLYTSGFCNTATKLYDDACKDDPERVDAVLFANSKYYVVVSPFNPRSSTSFTIRASLQSPLNVTVDASVLATSGCEVPTSRPTTSTTSSTSDGFPLYAIGPIITGVVIFILCIVFGSICWSARATAPRKNFGTVLFRNNPPLGPTSSMPGQYNNQNGTRVVFGFFSANRANMSNPPPTFSGNASAFASSIPQATAVPTKPTNPPPPPPAYPQAVPIDPEVPYATYVSDRALQQT